MGGGGVAVGGEPDVASKILSRECNQNIVARQDHLVLSTELISSL